MNDIIKQASEGNMSRSTSLDEGRVAETNRPLQPKMCTIITRTQLTKLDDQLQSRNLDKVTPNTWLLRRRGESIQIDLIPGTLRCDWRNEGARDLTFFDLDGNNTWENQAAIDSVLLWLDRYLAAGVTMSEKR